MKVAIAMSIFLILVSIALIGVIRYIPVDRPTGEAVLLTQSSVGLLIGVAFLLYLIIGRAPARSIIKGRK